MRARVVFWRLLTMYLLIGCGGTPPPQAEQACGVREQAGIYYHEIELGRVITDIRKSQPCGVLAQAARTHRSALAIGVLYEGSSGTRYKLAYDREQRVLLLLRYRPAPTEHSARPQIYDTYQWSMWEEVDLDDFATGLPNEESDAMRVKPEGFPVRWRLESYYCGYDEVMEWPEPSS